MGERTIPIKRMASWFETASKDAARRLLTDIDGATVSPTTSTVKPMHDGAFVEAVVFVSMALIEAEHSDKPTTVQSAAEAYPTAKEREGDDAVAGENTEGPR